jgi:hypothetical protein
MTGSREGCKTFPAAQRQGVTERAPRRRVEAPRGLRLRPRLPRGLAYRPPFPGSFPAVPGPARYPENGSEASCRARPPRENKPRGAKTQSLQGLTRQPGVPTLNGAGGEIHQPTEGRQRLTVALPSNPARGRCETRKGDAPGGSRAFRDGVNRTRTSARNRTGVLARVLRIQGTRKGALGGSPRGWTPRQKLSRGFSRPGRIPAGPQATATLSSMAPWVTRSVCLAKAKR